MNTKDEFWKQKLLAYLHDPPCKALDIGHHEDMAWSFTTAAFPREDKTWLRETQKALKDADWTAASADRFGFPKRECSAALADKGGVMFKHPLGIASYTATSDSLRQAEEALTKAVGGIDGDLDPKTRFFLYWRRWRENAVQIDGCWDIAYLPADTRIPDHSIWSHMSLVSALQACRNDDGAIEPAFLIFQVGPVQDFIAAARSTRDLWSGSYLLSWLTAHAMKAVTDEIGPDNIIFPSLLGQGIFDALHKTEVYDKISFANEQGGVDTLWQRMYLDNCRDRLERQEMHERLLTPSLPNRFVILVPAHRGRELATAARDGFTGELKRISEACWKHFSSLAEDVASEHLDNMKKRWDKQVEFFPQITWAIAPWQTDIRQTIDDFDKLPVNQTDDCNRPAAILRAHHKLATQTIPEKDRDERYYTNNKTELNNPGVLWSANYHTAEFLLAARRNTREFDQFLTDSNQPGTPKDALTGKEEIIGDEDLWSKIGTPFKENEGPYGALTIIKRLWCTTKTGYLTTALGLNDGQLKKALRFDSVASVACENLAKKDKQTDDDGEPKPQNPYVAVIAMDGDEMGKWISGANAPDFLEQLAKGKPREYLGGKVPKDLKRLLTPSYHMQFSEALGNFSNYLADRIVREFKGQLIYAGGDDVLAMVPADEAIDCARTLRAAFRGEEDAVPKKRERSLPLHFVENGFVCAGVGYPLMVPGPAADVSCGIAIAHYKHPLQDIVKEAQLAEKRAKRKVAEGGLGRGAFAISLLKRGGETIHWGAQWSTRALELYDQYLQLRGNEKLSGRFPYALAALLQPYVLEGEPDIDRTQLCDIIREETAHVIKQQKVDLADHEAEELLDLCRKYLDSLNTPPSPLPLDLYVKLFLTAAFIHRDRSDKEEE